MNMAKGRKRLLMAGVIKVTEDNPQLGRQKRDTLSARIGVTWAGVVLISVLCLTAVALSYLGQTEMASTLVVGGVVGYAAKLFGDTK
jgi:hypothetical protein